MPSSAPGGHQHGLHQHGTGENTADLQVRRYLFGAVLAFGVLAVIGVAVWWPRGDAPQLYGENGAPQFVDATIDTAEQTECPGLEFDFPVPCQQLEVRVTSGPNAGDLAAISIYPDQQDAPILHDGDQVVLASFQAPGREANYAYADLQRSTQLWVLVAAFAGTILLFGRWHGLRALAGLALSVWFVLGFLIPSLLRGNPPLGVAIAGGLVIAGVAVYVAHGAKVTTTVALLGTVVSVTVIAVLAAVAVSFAELTGLDQGAAGTLRITAETVDLRGLLVAGIVVGALGVLDDVTVTQVAAVAELRRANPALRGLELYRSAVRIGRDHVAAVVNTLVLAYAGASLPLLLLFSQGNTPFGRVATSQIVAVEIVRTVVGTIGLVLSVPVTTALAAAVLAPKGSSVDTAGRPDPDDEPSSAPRWDDFAPLGEADA